MKLSKPEAPPSTPRLSEPSPAGETPSPSGWHEPDGQSQSTGRTGQSAGNPCLPPPWWWIRQPRSSRCRRAPGVARSTTSRSLPVKAETLRLVTTTSPSTGVRTGFGSIICAVAEASVVENILFLSLISGIPGRKPTTTYMTGTWWAWAASTAFCTRARYSSGFSSLLRMLG